MAPTSKPTRSPASSTVQPAAKALPRRRRKEARPQELTAAALSLFVEKGFAATKLEEVAARAGVSKGTLYLYFDSKEALFKAVIAEGIVPALEEGEALLAEHADDPVALLRELLYGWWERIGNTELGGIPKLMISEARNFPEVAAYYHERVIQRGLRLIGDAVRLGVRRGLFRPESPELVGNLFIAPVLHLSMWRHSFAACCARDLDADAFLAIWFELFINGLGVRPAEGGR
ncbi:TetR/AcrR family transcriptional regulator [Pseudothauera nasutitermitis]|uniref:TetR/AcrR family transcriptional regulator n=1 Tax=Pseudothauera nasutitermitis TaxID=2565930 RepID=A0A4S4AQB6_9RHOO|nr:TetR/AcrR family transcriptional regulator [Pseudothauera nasutitermitis]THF61936.1 TetR/AcrR family transcriptional regulator [Pseudothauera nasutitermitis]